MKEPKKADAEKLKPGQKDIEPGVEKADKSGYAERLPEDIRPELRRVIERFPPLADNQLTEKVVESANQIWLAGLGAYAKIEQEGSRFFDGLVQEGENLENKTRDFVDRQLAAAKDQVDQVRAKATGSLGRIEKTFDEQVKTALYRLDIPSQTDVEDLSQRIDAITEQVAKLARKHGRTFE